jgi:hypothetical protein
MKKVAFFFGVFIIFLALMEIIASYFFVKETDNYPLRPSLITQKHTTAINKAINNYLAKETSSISYDPILGWVSPGIRGKREYGYSPPQDKLRISTFGDSFTYGVGVNNEQSWAEQINLSQKGYEVLNFGVPGYGLDQAYLRYIKEKNSIASNIVFIGYMAQNLERSVNVFRPFYNEDGGLPLGKPRFKLIDDELFLQENFFGDISDYTHLINHPNSVLADLGEHDLFYQMRGGMDLFDNLLIVRVIRHNLKYIRVRRSIYKNHQYNPNSEAYQVTEKIFDIFYQKVLGEGATPVILLFPEKKALKYFSEENKILYSSLIKHFEANDYNYINLLEAFEPFEGQYSPEALCPNHYSVAANKIVANYIISTLNKVATKKLS